MTPLLGWLCTIPLLFPVMPMPDADGLIPLKQKVQDHAYVKLPAKVETPPGLIIIKAETNAASVSWLTIDANMQAMPSDLLKDSRTGIFICIQPGTYKVYAVCAQDSHVSPFATCTVVVGGVPPDPPVPPKPDPPIPPKPDPTPPGPVKFMRVLFVYETSNPGNTSKIVNDKEVQGYLNSKSSMEWRFLDKDTSTAFAPEWVKAGMSRPRQSLPWLVIFSGDSVVFEGALPADVNATMAILKKFGG